MTHFHDVKMWLEDHGYPAEIVGNHRLEAAGQLIHLAHAEEGVDYRTSLQGVDLIIFVGSDPEYEYDESLTWIDRREFERKSDELNNLSPWFRKPMATLEKRLEAEHQPRMQQGQLPFDHA